MMSPNRFRKPVGLLLVCALQACATVPKTTVPVEMGENDLHDSAVEIVYSLSNSQYQLSLKARDGEVEAVNQVNDRTLDRKRVEPARYLAYANKISQVAAEFGDLKSALPPEECKTPFVVTVNKRGAPVQKVAGCRTNDESGRIGRLIQEGELLLLDSQ